MEKLLQLLNEYNCNKLGYVDKWKSENGKFILDYIIGTYVFRTHLYIISKEYGFIQWLVDTEQIDYWKVGEIVDKYKGSLREKTYVVSDCEYESMLMLLAISDDPISFLVSILK